MSFPKSGFTFGKSRHTQIWQGIGPLGIAAGGTLGPPSGGVAPPSPSVFFQFSNSNFHNFAPVDSGTVSVDVSGGPPFMQAGDFLIVLAECSRFFADSNDITISNIRDDQGNTYDLLTSLSILPSAARSYNLYICKNLAAVPSSISVDFTSTGGTEGYRGYVSCIDFGKHPNSGQAYLSDNGGSSALNSIEVDVHLGSIALFIVPFPVPSGTTITPDDGSFQSITNDSTVTYFDNFSQLGDNEYTVSYADPGVPGLNNTIFEIVIQCQP